ncbi:MAG: HNH endonuclease signature motif containing protein [Acidimicrobiales bacterium]
MVRAFRRLATPAQRSAALAASHGHCYWPGCTAPAHRCDTDHLTGWEDGSCTDIDNLAPICRFHNRLKHRERYRAERRPDGTVVVTDRFGVELATRYQHDP